MPVWKCDFCGGNSFKQMPGTYSLKRVLPDISNPNDHVMRYNMGFLGPDDNLKIVVRVCENCGRIQLFMESAVKEK